MKNVMPIRGRSSVPAIVVVGAIISGILLLLMCISLVGSLYGERVLNSRGVKAHAVVSDRLCKTNGQSIEGSSVYVEFPDQEGDAITAKLLVTSGFCNTLAESDSVTVTYDPNLPTRARVADGAYNNPAWKGMVKVFGVVGVVTALAVAWMWYRRRTRSQGM